MLNTNMLFNPKYFNLKCDFRQNRAMADVTCGCDILTLSNESINIASCRCVFIQSRTQWPNLPLEGLLLFRVLMIIQYFPFSPSNTIEDNSLNVVIKLPLKVRL